MDRSRLGRRRLALGWNCVGGFHHLIQHPLKINKAGRRNNYCIAFAPNFFGDTQEPSARILLERQEKRLAFNLNLHRFNCVFLNEWTRWRLGVGLPIGLALVGRGPFV